MKKLALIVALVFLSINNSYTCYWYGWEEFGYHFFDEEMISDPSLLYFVGYRAKLGLSYSEKAEEPKDGNLLAWQQYMGKDVSIEDLAEVVYKWEGAKVQEYLDNKRQLKADESANTVLSKWRRSRSQLKAMGNYLVFAKKCEKQAVKRVYYWDESSLRDEQSMQALLEEALGAYKNERDAFVQRRYAFQAIRMAFYMNDFDNALRLFNEFFAKEEKEDYIYFRALELKAGVHYRKGEAEAPYLYAKVFANAADREFVCLNSFSFTSQQEWDRSFQLCQTTEEKVVFYTLRALQPTANIVEEMANIADVDPNTPYLQLLYNRFMRDVQQKAFPAYLDKHMVYPAEKLQDYYDVDQLNRLCRRMMQIPDLKHADYWKIASANTEMLNRNFNEALALLAKVPQQSALKGQAKKIAFVAQLCALNRINASTADAIWYQLKNDKDFKDDRYINSFVQDVLSMLYYKNGDWARSYLVQNQLTDLQDHLHLKLINSIEEFIAKAKSPGVFDQFLLDKRCDGEGALDQLRQMRAVYYIQHNELDKAIEELKRCSAAHQRQDRYFTSPYLDRSIWVTAIWQPYFNVEIEEQKVEEWYKEYPFLDQRYNLLSYAQQLKSLEQRAEKDPNEAAQYYFLLGMAYFNTSPYGWHRPALYYAYSNDGHSKWDQVSTEEKLPVTFKDYRWRTLLYYDADIAVNYLEKAEKVASNDEWAARIVYLKAKVERTRDENYFSWWRKPTIENRAYWDCFNDLKTKYAHTGYYKDVLRECYDFQQYVYSNR